jgi:putative ATP-dependent endonuclease of OLD family
MKVRKLSIRHFRGIDSCDWHMQSAFVCLVGPGDSTKTTLLDAIGMALSRSYSTQFTDADFFEGDTSKPIVIEVVVTALPDQLVQESAFGKDRCGIRPNGDLDHDPVDGTDECLIVRLSVDATLEPTWHVVRPGEAVGSPISATQRQQLGFFRVGEYVDLHLRWARTSALTGMTEKRSDATSVILDAQRQARQAVFDAVPKDLQQAADIVKRRSRELGSAQYGSLRPGLDPTNASAAYSLVLHEGDVPLTNQGLGTRRLTSLSIQEEAVEGGSMVAIDEIEHGLEPHRLAHALRYLKQRAATNRLQVFLTTHSPVAVSALVATDLAVVASHNGETIVQPVPGELDDVQGAVRSGPSALLGKTIIVSEGSTEVGLVRRLFTAWDRDRTDLRTDTSVTAGLAVVNGGGGDMPPRRAKVFAQLGYPVAVIMDNDDPSVDSAVADARSAGANIIRWTKGCALEDEIVMNLSDEQLGEFLVAAAEERDDASVRQAVEARLNNTRLTGLDPAGWISAGADREGVRSAIASAAKGEKLSGGQLDGTRAWFKRESGGERLAELVVKHWETLKHTSIGTRLSGLQQTVYSDTPSPYPPGTHDADG